MAPIPPIIVKSVSSHSATLIFLHGLGDTGHGWASMFEQMFKHSSSLKHIKGVFPTAPVRPVTLNAGMPMPAWNDIFGLDAGSDTDKQGMEESCGILDGLVQAEVAAGIPRNRIVVGGFSQGGMVALNYAYKSCPVDRAVGGVVALSSWLGDRTGVQTAVAQVADKSRLPPLFMGHGSADPLVKFEFGQMSSEVLKGLGVHVAFKAYSGLAHSSGDEELRDVGVFLKDRLK